MRKYFLFAILLTLLCGGSSLAEENKAVTIAELIDLADTTKFTGVAASDSAGESMTALGDVNGDGLDDFLIAADGVNTNAGAAYLFYGQATDFTDQSLSQADVTFTGEAGNDQVGVSVAGPGDVNGDGLADILIGAHNSGAGKAYLIYGSASLSSTFGLGLADVKFTGESGDDKAGQVVAGAGDVNADGYADILIGAPYDDTGATDAGAVYLISGSDSLSSMILSGADAKLMGSVANQNIGRAIAGTGDVNGDGYDDFIVGDINDGDGGVGAGAGFLFYGRAASFTDANVNTANVKIVGETAADYAGRSVSGGGDVNGDGLNDILIGAVGVDIDLVSDVGGAYVIYGSASLTSPIDLSNADMKFTGEAANDDAGEYVAIVGDTNGDDYDDMLIGAYGNENYTGATYFVLGSDSLASAMTFTESLAYFTGESESDFSGEHITVAGDVDGDGMQDVLIGATGDDDIGGNSGAGYLGYLYVDGDGDGTPGTSGLLAGTDCNDSDATITEEQTYYQDNDGDGLGDPDETTTSCTNIAPDGYVDNSTDTDDTIANDGVEIPDDEIDNDGDGEVDEDNDESNPHPEYNDYDPADEDAYANAVTSVVGDVNGKIKVTFRDTSIYKFTIFGITTSKKTKVKQYNSTGYYMVLHPKGKYMGLVNIYNGDKLSQKTLSKKIKYSLNGIKILKFRKKKVAVATSKKKKKVKVSIAKILIGKEKLGKVSSKKFKKNKANVKKTSRKKNKLLIKSKKNKVLKRFLVTKKFKLKKL